MNTILIILDSLNRSYLPSYGNDWVKTPNLEKLAEKSFVFDKHFAGSMPTIPARREIWTGRHDFLRRPWGALEPWDKPLPRLAGDAGVTTMLVTDSYHLFEGGGQNYHIDFDGWEFFRGHEIDPWVTAPPKDTGHKDVEQSLNNYERNLRRVNKEGDYFSPRTFTASADWLEENAEEHDQFMLVIDEFDPHEPFDVPKHFWRKYDQDYDGPTYFWPEYGRWEGSDEELEHIKARYAAKITMADRYLGRVLEKMDDFGLWEDTAVVVTTDHGHFLGDHGFMGKPPCPDYNVISHLPLMVYLPDEKGKRVDSLTTTVDLNPTLLELLGAEVPGGVHGKSLLPLMKGSKDSVREGAVYGRFGKWINYTDGEFTYLRGPGDTNVPLYTYSNSWSFGIKGDQKIVHGGKIDLSKIKMGNFIPEIDMLIGRAPASKRPEEPSFEAHNHLYNIEEDYGQKNDLSGNKVEGKYQDKLRNKLKELNAPEEQLERLGL